MGKQQKNLTFPLTQTDCLAALGWGQYFAEGEGERIALASVISESIAALKNYHPEAAEFLAFEFISRAQDNNEAALAVQRYVDYLTETGSITPEEHS